MPILYCSEAFSTYTGYPMSEIKGKNCRFLQGNETDKNSIDWIRSLIKKEKPGAIKILNYKKNGDSFMNHFFISPLYDVDNNCIYYLGIQVDLIDIEKKEIILASSLKEDDESRDTWRIGTATLSKTNSLCIDDIDTKISCQVTLDDIEKKEEEKKDEEKFEVSSPESDPSLYLKKYVRRYSIGKNFNNDVEARSRISLSKRKKSFENTRTPLMSSTSSSAVDDSSTADDGEKKVAPVWQSVFKEYERSNNLKAKHK